MEYRMEWNGMEWSRMEWNGVEGWNEVEWNRIVAILEKCEYPDYSVVASDTSGLALNSYIAL